MLETTKDGSQMKSRLEISMKSLGRLRALIFAAFFLSACGGGYETVTKEGEGVKEWFLTVGGGGIEAFAVWPPASSIWPIATKDRPALLLLHAAKGRAQRFRRTMFSLAKEGIVTMSISLPGFGDSTGPNDFAGPRSVEAAIQAVQYLAGRRDVRKNGVAIYGYGLGATTGLLAASKSPDVHLVAVEGGIYDLEAAYQKLPPTDRERLRSILGGPPPENPAAFRMRSPIHEVGGLKIPVLILHSKEDRQVPLSEAENLASVLKKQGLTFRLIITKDRLGTFSPKNPSIKRWVIPFMKQHLAF
jgi:dipeptidyl aminopeptidase/acylaminoacyl peptidase